MARQRTRANIPRLAASAAIFIVIAAADEYWPASSDIEWRTYSQALLEARETRKPVYLDLYAAWCAPCKRMDVEVFPNDTVRKLLSDEYIPARIDIDSDQFSDSLRDTWKLRGIPTGLLLNPEGREVKRVVGFRSSTALIDWLVESGTKMFASWPPFPTAREFSRTTGNPILAVVAQSRQSADALQAFSSDSSFQAFLLKDFSPTFLAPYDSSSQWIDTLRRHEPLGYTPAGGVLFVVVTAEMQVLGQVIASPWEIGDTDEIRSRLSAYKNLPR